jgi:lipopolysaccharide transport system ATP-binding protein
MSGVAVSVEGLAKRYRIGVSRPRPHSRSGVVANLLLAPFGYLRTIIREPTEAETLWALRDVSFEVPEGQIMGIIGRNGSGKSTLLKILARITEPTAGRARLRGRVGSLLEVGAGFNPELTGRDNVYLNGAILGMRRAEIQSKFDDIVEFAGVERFIDTPVKRYSSGMYVRLAFAVAAHLEPEVLLIDEVLAVGDAEFQRRCIQRMESIGREGRTVIFVSHQMPVVARLCTRAVLLRNGSVVDDGPVEAVVAEYLRAETGTGASRTWLDPETAPGTDVARLRGVTVVDPSGQPVESADLREPVGVEITFDVLAPGRVTIPMLALHNSQGIHVFNALDASERWRQPAAPGTYVATAWVPPNLLNEGTYVVSAFVNELSSGKMERHAVGAEVVAFQVVDRGIGLSAKGLMAQTWGGAVMPLLEWTVRET